MRSNSLVLSLLFVGTMAVPLLSPAPAQAQSTRTWVSGTGNDANVCSRTAPCLTWAGAIAKTAAGGEIDALDAGGFGPLTITQSMTIDGGGGQVASTLAAGTNGITVSAGSTDIVVLRNLRFQGLLGNGSNPSGAGLSAIAFNSGAQLIIDNCDIVGFSTNGISISGNGYVAVSNTRIADIGNAGITAGGSATSAQIRVRNVDISGTTFGVAVGAGNTMVFSRSASSKAAYGVEVDPGGSLFVDNSVISFNSVGVQAGGQATLANSDIAYNSTGVAGGAGTFNSYTNNRFFGNGTNGNPATPLSPNPSNPTGQQ